MKNLFPNSGLGVLWEKDCFRKYGAYGSETAHIKQGLVYGHRARSTTLPFLLPKSVKGSDLLNFYFKVQGCLWEQEL
jgi:hypothetical protein